MQKGFTLLEVMIVVAIVGILAAIAYPNYQEYIIRTKRGDMQTEMMRMAQEAQRYQIANRRFTGMTVANLGSTGNFPSNTPLYDLAFNPAPSANAWTLVATPRAGTTQAGNGVICLNNQGHKLWVKGGTSCAALSAGTTWTN